MQARQKPLVLITSNRTRDIHDALKRRCLYHWIDYPSYQKELRIIRTRLPGIGERLSRQITHFMQKLRTQDFLKKPGGSESLDWAGALIALTRTALDEAVVLETLGCILKYQEDIRMFREEIWIEAQNREEYLCQDPCPECLAT